MKELSIKEKAKAYDEIIEKAIKMHNENCDACKACIEELIPELKESEDEIIRKDIVFYIVALHKDDEERARWIAWLEKQDSYYTFEIKKGHWYKCVCDYMPNGSDLMFKHDRLYYCRSDWRLIGEIDERNVKDIGVNGYKSFFRLATNQEIKDWLEKQNEPKGKTALEAAKEEKVDNQNCVKPTDKVEPKFHEGNWVFIEETKGYKHGPFQIKTVDSFGYSFDEYHTIPFMYEDLLSKWTIQDAKNGDVLYTSSTASHETFIFKSIDEKGNAKCYFAYDSEDGFRDGKYHFIGRATNCKPATKEQRDLLFSKIKEAGYEWDVEHKQLKKLNRPAWSEEDENVISLIFSICNDFLESFEISPASTKVVKEDVDKIENWLKPLKDRVQPEQKWSKNDEDMLILSIKYLEDSKAVQYDRSLEVEKCKAWLKSLRPQNTWKPSEEQMEALKGVQEGVFRLGILKSLYNDLKKL